MRNILLATDADWIRDDVVAALNDDETEVSRVHRGDEVVEAVRALQPELVILDLQIGNMGGIATCHALHLEASGERIDPVKILLLLDRADDRFLARSCGADGWLVKPAEAFRIRRAAEKILAGERYEDGASAVA